MIFTDLRRILHCRNARRELPAARGVDAIVVPGGFGIRGIEGKLGALRWARGPASCSDTVPGTAVWSLRLPDISLASRCFVDRNGSRHDRNVLHTT